MNTSRISKVFLVFAIVILISSTLAVSRDYQDSWILEGIEIPFMLFTVVYMVAFFYEKSPSWLVVLAIIGRTVFLLLPNLKYVWFQGPFMDQHRQYALANHVFNEGFISTERAFAQDYLNTPLIHILLSVFSLILNIPIVDSMKYLPVLLSWIYPFLTYVIVRKMEFSNGKSVLKYSLFFSSVPFAIAHYVISGTFFGIFFEFLIFSVMVLSFQKSDRRYWIICIILMFALVATHSITSIILNALFLAILVIQRISWFKPKRKSIQRNLNFPATIVIAFTSINAAWLMFEGSDTFQKIVRLLFIATPSGATPSTESLPTSFFDHIRVNLFSAVKSFSVAYGADALLLLLTLAAMIILLSRLKKLNRSAIFFSLFGWMAVFLLVMGVLIKLGGPRSLTFLRPLFPIFLGIFFVYMSRNLFARKWIRPAILLLIMLLVPIQLYRCQPLIPPANVLYNDLPSEVPLGYVGLVNSVYQREMITFAENHINGKIAADFLTMNQLTGLTNISFSVKNVIWYYPLDKSQAEQLYDYFLIHFPGKSGSFDESPTIRTQTLILETIQNSSVVYTNGESYILANNYSKP